jgi:hypothetical protein
MSNIDNPNKLDEIPNIEGIDLEFLKNILSQKSPKDPVNPGHYKKGNLQYMDVCEQRYCERSFKDIQMYSIGKYLWRAEDKGIELEQYKKAQWHMNLLVEFEEALQKKNNQSSPTE